MLSLKPLEARVQSFSVLCIPTGVHISLVICVLGTQITGKPIIHCDRGHNVLCSWVRHLTQVQDSLLRFQIQVLAEIILEQIPVDTLDTFTGCNIADGGYHGCELHPRRCSCFLHQYPDQRKPGGKIAAFSYCV